MKTQILAAVLMACAPANRNGASASVTRITTSTTLSTRLRGRSPERSADHGALPGSAFRGREGVGDEGQQPLAPRLPLTLTLPHGKDVGRGLRALMHTPHRLATG